MARTAVAIDSAWSLPRVAQVTSTRTRSGPDAVTSRAVTTPPPASMRPVSSLTARGRAGSSSRIVMEEETLAPLPMGAILPLPGTWERQARRDRHGLRDRREAGVPRRGGGAPD